MQRNVLSDMSYHNRSTFSLCNQEDKQIHQQEEYFHRDISYRQFLAIVLAPFHFHDVNGFRHHILPELL